MRRGNISGFIWGGLAGALALSAASVLTELPPEVAETPRTSEIDVAAISGAESGSAPAVPGGDASGAGAALQGLSAPNGGGSDARQPDLQTGPATVPGVNEPQVALATPDAGTAAPATAGGGAQGVPAPTVGAAPVAPQTSGAPALQTGPAPLPVAEPPVEAAEQPELAEESAAPAPAPQPTPAPADDPAEDPAVTEPQMIRTPVPEIANLAPNVTTNRLPRIGVAPGGGDAAADPTRTAALSTGALDRNAVDFENPESKPLFSILLLDDGAGGVDPEVAENLPFTVSFAVDAALPDAGARAARYRERGFEVLVMLRLPEGAEARDVEVAFESAFTEIPDAVAVLDTAEDGFSVRRMTAQQVVGILSESGHGLVTYDRGLNAAQQIAERQSVPGTVVFRAMDGAREGVPVVRRYLDRAAFRAQQEGQVVMVGRLYPDTIEALMAWALEDRAASLAVAPISAVLRAGR